jgi:hypothetical protein
MFEKKKKLEEMKGVLQRYKGNKDEGASSVQL